MDKNDRRHSNRQEKEETVQVLLTPDYCIDLKKKYEQIPAKLVNQSESGLYIETDRVIFAGENVSIMMVSSGEYQPGEAYDMYDGLVLRCEKIDVATSRFGIGIKTLRKVVCARILTSRF